MHDDFERNSDFEEMVRRAYEAEARQPRPPRLTKLRNGKWGVRLEGDDVRLAAPGTCLDVPRKGGGSTAVRVLRMFARGSYTRDEPEWALAEIAFVSPYQAAPPRDPAR